MVARPCDIDFALCRDMGLEGPDAVVAEEKLLTKSTRTGEAVVKKDRFGLFPERPFFFAWNQENTNCTD